MLRRFVAIAGHSCWKRFAVGSGLVIFASTLCGTTKVAGRTSGPNAQSAASKAISIGTPEEEISTWQYHAGDSPLATGARSPLWADPTFDDSNWKQVKAAPLANQNLPYSQISWYRRRLTIARQDPARQLAILLDAANTYEVYWNGRLLGGVGTVPARFSWPFYDTADLSLPLPIEASVSGVLAIRVWCQYPSSLADDCGLLGSPLIGGAVQQQDHPQERLKSKLLSDFLFVGVAVLAFLAAMVALLVYLRGKRNPMYLWFAIFLLGASGNGISPNWINAGNWYECLTSLSIGAILAGFLLLLLWVTGMQHHPRLRRIVAAVALLIAGILVFNALVALFWARAGERMQRADAIGTVLTIVLYLAPLVLLGIAIVRKQADREWPVILAGSAFFIVTALNDISGQWPNLIHWHLDWLRVYHLGYFRYSVLLILLMFLLLALGFSVFRHFLAERRQQERAERELLAAREVQQVLVPDKVPAIPGYAIASVYRPAAEVGGDFFQILPTDDGGALVVIGDVSGKGVKAAMIVSLIVGTLRTVASFSQEPGEILKQLNTRLHGRMAGGFVTCLVLRIAEGHEIVAAHAGHISPYIDGKEFALEGSIPLGIVPGMEYEEMPLHLAEGETLTLLTDGVPEAQNARRELFGFSRLTALLTAHPTVEQVVEAACNFGQQDDITVLTLTRLSDAAARPAVTLNLATQEA